MELRGGIHRFRGIAAIGEIKVRLGRQHSAHRFANHRLVVHQQNATSARRLLGCGRLRCCGLGLIGHEWLLWRIFGRGVVTPAARAIAPAIRSSGRISAAASILAAAFGMPYTMLVA